MGRSVRQVSGYTAEQIKSLFNSEDKYRIGLRLYAVYQVAKGKPGRQLEELYNTSFKQILNWVSRFEKEGIEGLRDKKGRGRKPLLTDQQRNQLKEMLLNQQPLGFGYNSASWTGPLLIDWIAKNWGIAYKKTRIYSIIKSLGLTYQKSRGFYPEADQHQQEEFKYGLKKTP